MKTLLGAALLVLALAGCSQSGGGSTPLASAATSAVAPSAVAPSAVAPSAAASTTAAASVAPSAVAGTPVVVRDFTLDPKDVSVKGSVVLAVTNQGPTIHNVAIRDAAGKILGTTKDLGTGESATLTADIPAGTYTLFCSLPGHESLGIKGTLSVTR